MPCISHIFNCSNRRFNGDTSDFKFNNLATTIRLHAADIDRSLTGIYVILVCNCIIVFVCQSITKERNREYKRIMFFTIILNFFKRVCSYNGIG